jgi:hypothetical protein
MFILNLFRKAHHESLYSPVSDPVIVQAVLHFTLPICRLKFIAEWQRTSQNVPSLAKSCVENEEVDRYICICRVCYVSSHSIADSPFEAHFQVRRTSSKRSYGYYYQMAAISQWKEADERESKRLFYIE